jgi:acyl-coenzyme A thioesterase PaaI-like protein
MVKERGQVGAEDAWLGAFVLRSQPGQVETLLPYRDEFACEQGRLSRSILAAFADLTGQRTLESSAAGSGEPRTISVEYFGVASAGQQLHGRGSLVDDAIHIEIRTSDDRTLVARARIALTGAAPAVPSHRQPIYPN